VTGAPASGIGVIPSVRGGEPYHRGGDDPLGKRRQGYEDDSGREIGMAQGDERTADRHGEHSGEAADAAGRSGSGRREPPELVKRLQRRRKAYRERGLPYRVAWVTAAVIVIAAGLAMIALPGPALLVIPIGLAMLSLEFAWAERVLDRTLERGIDAKGIALNASRKQKIAGAAAIACAVGAVGAVAVIYFI
jgi:uncharacterized protein (TIGR02611 family)